MKTKATCNGCETLQCNVRQECPDNAQSKSTCVQKYEIWPKLTAIGETV